MQKLKVVLSHDQNPAKENYRKGLGEQQEAYLKQVVTHLETFLGLRLSPTEIDKVWVPMLAEYPKWKLEQLRSYRLDEKGQGRTLAHICKWLDERMPDAKDNPSYQKPMEKNLLPYHLGPEFRKCLSCMMNVQTSSKFNLQEKEILQSVWVREMANKFPNYKA